MCRYETKEEEKKLADQIKLYQYRVQPADFDINPYFLLNEKSPILEMLMKTNKNKK